MMMSEQLAKGAHNLLMNCAEVRPGTRLAIIHENPEYGWYDLEAPMAVATVARQSGIDVTLLEVGSPENARDARVGETIERNDCTIFFARIGDQDRFAAPHEGKTCVMCYARDARMLGSAYGWAEHQAFIALKEAVNDILLDADEIRIACPLGTSLLGKASAVDRQQRIDVGIRRFPLGVHQPISASLFQGQVVLQGYLTPTGSRVYNPAFLLIDNPVLARVESGNIIDFDGNVGDVARVREHYKMVADTFGIEANRVHSWHAGIHPGCSYAYSIEADPDRWSNTVFTHPKFLHLHTCGSYAPGEICWMVPDHTVKVNGTALWRDGRLVPAAFTKTHQVVQQWPALEMFFAEPQD